MFNIFDPFGNRQRQQEAEQLAFEEKIRNHSLTCNKCGALSRAHCRHR